MKLLFLVCLCCSFSPAFPQVRGRVISLSGEALPAANVLLYRATDSGLIKAAVTDTAGRFYLPAFAGRYLLQCSFTGFQTWHSPMFELRDTLDMGDVILQSATLLDEVQVSAAKPLFRQQPGGLVVNVQSSVLTKGSTLLEVLERMPGILVDRRTNAVTLNSQGVMVMINGKLQRMGPAQLLAYLNSLRADDVAQIELLDAPPAGYDAEGTGGLINIVLKKNKTPGLSGNLGLTAGYGKGEKASANAGISYSKDKYDLYANYTYNRNHDYYRMTVNGYHAPPMLAADTYNDFRSNGQPLYQDHTLTLGADIRPNDKWSAGGSLQLSQNQSNTRIRSRGEYILPPDSLLIVTTAANNLNRWRNGVLSTYLDRTFAGGGQLGLSADYLRYRQYNPSRMSNAYFGRNDQPAVIRDDSLQAPEHRGEGATIIQLGVLTLKYTRPLPGQLKLEAGIKGTYSSSDSRSALYSLVDGEWANRAVSSRYSMREGIGAVWISMAATINPKTSLTFGGRYEYVGGRIRSADGKEPPVARNQGNFFPNIAFTRQVNDKTDWLLSYTQRISRPSYNDLSSYLSYNDPVSVFSGNPRLRNTISHLLKFGYNYNGYAFSALTNYTRRPIVYSQAVYGPDKTLAYFTPQNLAYEGYAALQAVLPFKPWSWWNMNYTLWGGVKQLRITFTEMPVTKTYPMLTLNFSEVFILPAGFSAELSGWYTSRHYYGTIEVRGRGLMNAGLRKDLGSNHGSFNLIVTDVFRQNRNNSLFGKLTREAYGLDNDIFIYPEHTQATLAKLTYTRSFGGAQKKPREAAGDERGRVRQQ